MNKGIHRLFFSKPAFYSQILIFASFLSKSDINLDISGTKQAFLKTLLFYFIV